MHAICYNRGLKLEIGSLSQKHLAQQRPCLTENRTHSSVVPLPSSLYFSPNSGTEILVNYRQCLTEDQVSHFLWIFLPSVFQQTNPPFSLFHLVIVSQPPTLEDTPDQIQAMPATQGRQRDCGPPSRSR